jgi:nucleoside-diphosphate-sugar epimerase
MKYVVAGSTGLIGKNLINVISKDSETLALTRRNFNFPNNVTEKIVNFDNEYDLPKAEHLFICLGFPVELFDLVIMRKSVKKLFYKVDYDYVCKLAEKAKNSGIENLSVVSAVGASKNSFNYYLKTKGLMEEQLKKLNFHTLNIFQPSHLLGKREKPIGHDVKLFEDITNATGNLLFGPFAKFKNVQANEIANLMFENSKNCNKGINYFNRMDV